MVKVLGILGGMGPLATVDFMRKLIEETPSDRDQDHIPVVAYSVPQVPDRTLAIMREGETPLPALLEGVCTLKQAGAVAIVIPCNTAHYWYDELVREGGLPILHIADTALGRLGLAKGKTIGLMGTTGTMAAGFFQQRLLATGYRCITVSACDQERLVMGGIAGIKAGDLTGGAKLIEAALRKLLDEGADAVVLACTEIPVVLDRLPQELAERCVDATRELAKSCVAWWKVHLDQERGHQ